MSVEPITISITRTVDPERAKEVAAWARAGQDLLSASPGYLGSGWIRPDPQSPDWHMLFRFADAASLAAWEASPERAWWVASAQGLVHDAHNLLWGALLSAWPLPLRLLVVVVTVTPIMTYLALPLVTRALRPWLQRRPRNTLDPQTT